MSKGRLAGKNSKIKITRRLSSWLCWASC